MVLGEQNSVSRASLAAKQGETGLPAIALRRQLQAGQILLIVVLVIIVASTIGLSLASRSITSLRTATEEAESQKALAAAEAGIERAVQGNVVSTGLGILNDNLSNKSQYTVDINQGDSSKFVINGGALVPKDEGADVWFIGHNADGSLNYSDYTSTSPNFLNLYWGSASEVCGTANLPAAIQVIILTRDRTSPNEIKSHRYTYDSCNSQRANNFGNANSTGNFTVSGKTFKYSTPGNDLANDITGNKNIILMRVIPIYKDTAIAVSTCNPADNNCTPLPSQGYLITSTGTSGQASRKLQVFKGYPQTYLPYLSYGLFVAN